MSKMVRWFGIAVPVVALALGGWALAEEPKKPEAKPEAKKEEPKKDVKPAAAAKDIVDTAVEAKFTTLADLLKAAGLVESLKGEGPFTVFAPTDEAFAKLPKALLDDLKKPENKQKLADILTYHVVKGKVHAAEVMKMDGKTTKTLNAKAEIRFTVKDGKVMLNDKATVTKTDVAASNGVIHVIDTVIMPPGEKKEEPKKEEPKPAPKEEKKP